MRLQPQISSLPAGAVQSIAGQNPAASLQMARPFLLPFALSTGAAGSHAAGVLNGLPPTPQIFISIAQAHDDDNI